MPEKNICKCVEWFLVAAVAAEALEHNATVSGMAKDLHKALEKVLTPEQMEDIEYSHPLMLGYLSEHMAEMALSGSLGQIRDGCQVDISKAHELAREGYKAIEERATVKAADSFGKMKVMLMSMAQDICNLRK